MKRSRLGPGSKSIERGSSFKAAPRPLKRDPNKPLRSSAPSRESRRRNSTLNPGRGFSASTAQRQKVAAQVCAVCQAEHVDAAHLAPRSHGGCDSADCVIGLCRRHHEEFDAGRLDLLPHVSGQGFEAELAHMQGHYSDPYSVLRRLSGREWRPIERTG